MAATNLHFFESLDQVNRAIQGADDLDRMMGRVLDALLAVFGCDRAWFVYPCDPDAESWFVPMERTRPEYPGAYALGIDFPMNPDVAETLRILLGSAGPVDFGAESEYPIPSDVEKEFSVRSFIAMAIYPNTGKPWVLGLHQCSGPRNWTKDEKRLFSEIGRRLSDALTTLLVSRNLRDSEERFRHAFEFAGIGMGILSIDGRWLRANRAICEMLGYSEDELCQTTYQKLTHPDDLVRGREDARRVIAGEIPYMQIEKRYRHRDGHYIWARLTTSVVRSSTNEPLYFVSQIESIDKRKKAEQQLSLLSFALNRVQVGVYLIDETSRIQYVNEEVCRTLGYSQDKLLTFGIVDIDPEFPMSHWGTLWNELRSKGTNTIETSHRRNDGSTFPVEVSANYFEYDGRGYSLALVHDITSRKLNEAARRKAEAALHESDERFRQMAENIQEVFWLTDTQKKQMLYVSPAYETIWGKSCDNLYAEPLQWIESVHPEDRKRVNDAIAHQASGDYDIEYRIIRPDGTFRDIHDRAFPIRDSAGNVYRIVGVAQDITARKAQEAHIKYLAYHDALTGLPNRALVMNRLGQAIAQAQRHNHMLAVLVIDLDRFKTINDTLGHPAGDTLLQQVGVCLAERLREIDTVGRVGGDEFLILLPELATVQDIAHVTEKIHESLSVPFQISLHELHVTASTGISVYPRDAEDAETLVKYADTALYLAKEQGRDTFRFFSPDLDAKVSARLRIENDLRSAIDRNELLLHYQPQMNLMTGKWTGVEALLRWQHPVHGMVSPADFIPIAEETGMIIPIGEWVLRTACAQDRSWQHSGVPEFRMSVNLSGRQLEQTDVTATIERILQETECDPHLLELEITESTVINQPESVIVKLQALNKMGIKLAMDDFGTGYSSLAYLKRFPLDRLKIDKSFVDGIPDDNDDMALVQTIIVLARQLRLEVTAEGVETEAQRSFLKANGCDEMQGYLLSKPLPPEKIEGLSGFPRNHG